MYVCKISAVENVLTLLSYLLPPLRLLVFQLWQFAFKKDTLALAVDHCVSSPVELQPQCGFPCESRRSVFKMADVLTSLKSQSTVMMVQPMVADSIAALKLN